MRDSSELTNVEGSGGEELEEAHGYMSNVRLRRVDERRRVHVAYVSRSAVVRKFVVCVLRVSSGFDLTKVTTKV